MLNSIKMYPQNVALSLPGTGISPCFLLGQSWGFLSMRKNPRECGLVPGSYPDDVVGTGIVSIPSDRLGLHSLAEIIGIRTPHACACRSVGKKREMRAKYFSCGDINEIYQYIKQVEQFCHSPAGHLRAKLSEGAGNGKNATKNRKRSAKYSRNEREIFRHNDI
jgi:hypothetical protein